MSSGTRFVPPEPCCLQCSLCRPSLRFRGGYANGRRPGPTTAAFCIGHGAPTVAPSRNSDRMELSADVVAPADGYLSKRYPHGPRTARAGFSYDKRDATHAHGINLHVRQQGCCLSRKARLSGRIAGTTLLLLMPNGLILALSVFCHAQSPIIQGDLPSSSSASGLCAIAERSRSRRFR